MRIRIGSKIFEIKQVRINDCFIDKNRNSIEVDNLSVKTGKDTEKIVEQLLEKGFADLSQYM